jgi:hypothetical protein
MSNSSPTSTCRRGVRLFSSVFCSLLFGLVFAISGCESANRTQTDYSDANKLWAYKTYSTIALGKSSTTPADAALQEVVTQTLDNQLLVRYVSVKAGQKADFSIRFFINELEALPQPAPVSGGIGVAGGSGGYSGSSAGISLNFPIGAAVSPLRLRLVIDVIDNASGKQVWRGSQTINTDAADLATRDKAVATAAMEIIAAFPPS